MLPETFDFIAEFAARAKRSSIEVLVEVHSYYRRQIEIAQRVDLDLIARAIQFFLPGVPQVYHVGLLAGENDMAVLERSGVGRDINRHHFSRDEIDAALQRPVVRDLLDLIRLRNRHPAFAGSFELQDSDDDRLAMRWTQNRTWIALAVSLTQRTLLIEGDDGSGPRRY